MFALFKRQYKNSWSYFKQNYKPEKINCNALVIHAKHDEVVFINQSKTFFEKFAGVKEFHVLAKADHHLTRESYKQETSIIIDRWLKKNYL
ncbi:hypothetical protein HZA75_05575 [Candidatus Roizmanbacteria bacterium]|nr:hypothetical protein [Candidatus Roizmanbacteria bacterium]